MKCCLEGTGFKHFPAVSGTRQGLIAGHLASRVAAQAPLASRARSGFLASLKELQPQWKQVFGLRLRVGRLHKLHAS